MDVVPETNETASEMIGKAFEIMIALFPKLLKNLLPSFFSFSVNTLSKNGFENFPKKYPINEDNVLDVRDKIVPQKHPSTFPLSIIIILEGMGKTISEVDKIKLIITKLDLEFALFKFKVAHFSRFRNNKKITITKIVQNKKTPSIFFINSGAKLTILL